MGQVGLVFDDTQTSIRKYVDMAYDIVSKEKSSCHDVINVSILAGATWKSSRITLQFSLNSSYSSINPKYAQAWQAYFLADTRILYLYIYIYIYIYMGAWGNVMVKALRY